MGEDNQQKIKTPKGGVSGFFKRVWHTLVYYSAGFVIFFKEIFTFHKKFDLKKVPRRPGEVAVITGGGRGIGFEIVKKLLILDMHVVIGCRNKSSGTDAVEKLRKSGISTGTINVLSLDLMSFESVREFAQKVLQKYPKIHLLINNGGIMTVPYTLAKDGNEAQFQVNYLSHFLLTNLLLPKLIRGGRVGKTSRIVNVSSVAHKGGKINFDDINMQQMYSTHMAYMSSKLMQVVSANDFNQKLEKGGVNVRAYSVHPGLVKTELHRTNLGTSIVSFLLGVFYKSPEQGADTVMYAAISSKFEGEGGLYFENSKTSSPNSLATKVKVQKQLWDVSCRLTGWEDIPISELVKQVMITGRKEPQKFVPGERMPKTQQSKELLENDKTAPKSLVRSNSNKLERQQRIDVDVDEEDKISNLPKITKTSPHGNQGQRDSIISSSSSLSSTSTHTVVGNEQVSVVIIPATATEASSSSSEDDPDGRRSSKSSSDSESYLIEGTEKTETTTTSNEEGPTSASSPIDISIGIKTDNDTQIVVPIKDEPYCIGSEIGNQIENQDFEAVAKDSSKENTVENSINCNSQDIPKDNIS